MVRLSVSFGVSVVVAAGSRPRSGCVPTDLFFYRGKSRIKKIYAREPTKIHHRK